MHERDPRTTTAPGPRPSRRRVDRARGDDGEVRRRRPRRHARDVHGRRARRDPGARARAPRQRPRRRPGRAPPGRARSGDGGARRHRPPLPRRVRHLPRLRHEVARRRLCHPGRRGTRQRVLERRPPEAADHLVTIIREVRPQVLVTYDQFGGYGHPDHIQAHRVATYATTLAAVPSYRKDLGEPWEIAKVYWSATRRAGCATLCADCGSPVTPRPSVAWTPTATWGRSSRPTS